VLGGGVSRSRATALAALLITVGLALAPGYWAWCEFGSGERGPSAAITERAERWVLEDGSIQHFKGGLAHRPAELDLEPSMSPIRLRLRFDFVPDDRPARLRNAYQATMFERDHVAMQRAFDLVANGERTVSLGAVDVFVPARYVFVLEEAGAPSRVPRSVVVETMLRVCQPLRPIEGAGVVSLLSGLALIAWELAASRKP
jgi:hypothetical protein